MNTKILVWPIVALPNDLSANQKGVFSLRSYLEWSFTTSSKRTFLCGYLWKYHRIWWRPAPHHARRVPHTVVPEPL